MKTPSAEPSQYSKMHEIIRLNNYFILLFNMKRSYTDYINVIDEMENIEQVLITDNRCKKICYFILELIKFLIQYIKNINININGKKEKQKE